MASKTFTIGEFTGNDIAANITLTEVGGAIQVSVSVANGYSGDLRGLFFHIGNESLISSLSITGTDVTNRKFGPANSVDDVDGAVISPGKFDFGVEIGSEGIGKDDIRSTTFTISSSARTLTLADFINANPNGFDVGVRITSVGSDRQGSSKLGGEIPGDTFTPNPAIFIDKVTNGFDGKTILEGSDITWSYTVSNAGNVGLSNVSVTDDKGVTPIYQSGDADSDSVLDVGEKWLYQATGKAQAGDYSNIGTVTGKYNVTTVKATDPSSYFGANPGIAINKLTNGFDGKTILEGSAITWTYAVTNTGNVALSNVAVTDDKLGTITSFSGDTDNDSLLDLNETWTYTKTGTAVAGNYSNIGTVTGSFTDGLGKTEKVTDDDPSSYFGANPGINIDKVTNNYSVQGDGLLIQQGSAIEWIYNVTNTGNVSLSNVSVTDNKEGVTPVGVDANNDSFIDGDINKDKILDVTETWTYKAPGTAILGSYQNTGTATGSFTDGLGKTETVNDSDDSSYTGVKPAGARTPGFWKNWAAVWDGNASNDSTFKGREGFPGGDILLAPYSASTTDPVTGQKTLGVLVGDWNRNGVTDGTEKTIFYTLGEAMTIISADQKTQQDKRYTLDRSLVASWLNYLAVNPAPQGDMNQAIQWIQEYTKDENGDGKGDGNLTLGTSVPASSQAWANPSDVFNGLPTGEILNAKLDYYNNTGSFGVQPV